jgi:hypothetical protein
MGEYTHYPNGVLSEEAEAAIDMEKIHTAIEQLEFGTGRPILLGQGESVEPMLAVNDVGEQVEVLRVRSRAQKEDLYAHVGGMASGLIVFHRNLQYEDEMLDEGADGAAIVAKQQETAHHLVAGTSAEVLGQEASLQDIRVVMLAASAAVKRALVAA